MNEHWFSSVVEAEAIVEAWRRDYNTVRPHSSLGYLTPEEAIREEGTLPVRLSYSLDLILGAGHWHLGKQWTSPSPDANIPQ